VATRDFPQARRFYEPVMAALGLRIMYFNDTTPFISWANQAGDRPWFFLTLPQNGSTHEPGNGQMNALLAPDRATVDHVYSVAMENLGRCEGPPGLRLHYHADFYAAYVRDPDGNKLCFVCHEPEA
tara:strand:- start:42871 stop:43248 length:378 start_codon:yes stop_codon:yes gene_type:complete